jgi:hypothetical protein
MIVVFSRPGREELTAETVRALEEHGGGHRLPLESKCLFWVGETPPPPTPWRALIFPQPPGGSVPDFWRLLRALPDLDLVVLEDDIRPCRNAVPYMEWWPSLLFTSFYNPRGLAVGPRNENECFTYSQAIKIPRALAARLRAEDPAQTGRRDHDNAIGMLLLKWRAPIYYHRSLVEHVGAPSIIRGSGTRPKAPPDFVGLDYDAWAGRAAS